MGNSKGNAISSIHQIVNEKYYPEAVINYLKEIIASFDAQSSIAWIEEVKKRNSSYHRKTLLQQGRAEFDNPPSGLTGEELILLYNYYYMPMHLSSSYMLYSKILASPVGNKLYQNRNPVFLDWGCGTFASAIAFSSLIKEYTRGKKKIRNTTYYGIDISENMLNYCLKLADLKYVWQGESSTYLDKLLWHYIIGVHVNSLPFTYEAVLQDSFIFYQNFFPDEDFLLSLYKQREKDIKEAFKEYKVDVSLIEDEFTLILNFSYLFASHTLSPVDLAVVVNRMLHKYERLNVFAVFQNPKPDFLNTKWETFKSMVPMKSLMSGQDEIPYYSQSTLKYEVLHKSSGEKYKSIGQLRMLVNSNDKDIMLTHFKELFESGRIAHDRTIIVAYGMNENYQPPTGITHEELVDIIIKAATIDGFTEIPRNFRWSILYVSLLREKGFEAFPFLQ